MHTQQHLLYRSPRMKDNTGNAHKSHLKTKTSSDLIQLSILCGLLLCAVNLVICPWQVKMNINDASLYNEHGFRHLF